MVQVYVGNITATIGASAESKADVVCEKIMWKDVPADNLKPVTIINSVSPLAFHQLHKWVEGELHIKSEGIGAIHGQGVDYLPPGAASPACPYFVVTMVDHAGGAPVVTFDATRFQSEEFTHSHDGEAITIYRFKALSATLAPA